MEWLGLLMLVVLAVQGINRMEQAGRVALLAQHLSRFHVENLMGQLTEGYLRALDTTDADRRRQLWGALESMEQELSRQFSAFAEAFAKVYGGHTLVSRLPFALPRATQLFPKATIDLRQLLGLHARGIADVVANQAGRSQRDKAYTLTAELYLMQHSCQWFCRSKNTASARLLARHKTSYQQVLGAVSEGTRRAYTALVGVAG
ncbi:MAG TPA: hypothetical protein VFY35_11670 [Burkholderiaceae bacterium]|nr:hypothetical protein [Burkholderiaceae bacterium]